jgi:hypothetical protein
MNESYNIYSTTYAYVGGVYYLMSLDTLIIKNNKYINNDANTVTIMYG